MSKYLEMGDDERMAVFAEFKRRVDALTAAGIDEGEAAEQVARGTEPLIDGETCAETCLCFGVIPYAPGEPAEVPEPPSMPADPFGAVQVPYVALHEAYLHLRRGGFAWHEALFYLASNMSLNVLMAQQQPRPPEQET